MLVNDVLLVNSKSLHPTVQCERLKLFGFHDGLAGTFLGLFELEQ